MDTVDEDEPQGLPGSPVPESGSCEGDQEPDTSDSEPSSIETAGTETVGTETAGVAADLSGQHLRFRQPETLVTDELRCVNCNAPVPYAVCGRIMPCRSCGSPYPLGDCSDYAGNLY
jgi:hypothetical protein